MIMFISSFSFSFSFIFIGIGDGGHLMQDEEAVDDLAGTGGVFSGLEHPPPLTAVWHSYWSF